MITVFLLVFFSFYTTAYSAPDSLAIMHQAGIGAQEEKDLELFSFRNNQGEGLFTFLNHTHTQKGKETLKSMIQRPTSNCATLINRQDIVKTLLHNEHLLHHLDIHLSAYKNHEAQFSTFWKPEDPVLKAALQEFFYKRDSFKSWNNSPFYLAMGQCLHVVELFAPVVEHAVLHYLISSKLKKSLGLDCCAHDHHDHELDHKHLPHGHKHHDHSHDHHHSFSAANLMHNSYNIAHWLVHIWGIKALTEHIMKNMNVLSHLKKRLVSASICIKSAHAIIHDLQKESLIAQNPLLSEKLAKVHTTLSGKGKIKDLMLLLQSSTFNNDSMSVTQIGTVLACYNLLYETKHELDEIVQLIGEIDAFASIAKLYDTHSKKAIAFSFAQYNESNDCPMIQLEEFWNPFIDPNVVTPNSISMGYNYVPRVVMVTGNNTEGKSTTLKAISLCILLAQTLGIAPARSIRFTPFEKIITSLNISDDILQGRSLLAAELIRAQEMLHLLQTLPTNKWVFITIDEIFRSTAYEKGQSMAYEFIKELGSLKNVISLFATHFTTKITNLEKEMPENFKNYKVYLNKDKFPYRFCFGPGTGNPEHVLDHVKETVRCPFLHNDNK